MADIRFALRALGRSPLLALVVVLSLGLGIGANTAIFSLLHQIILRSLPVQEPERLVFLNSPGEFKSGSRSLNNAGGLDAIFSYRMFRGLEKAPQGVTAVAGFRLSEANLSYRKQTVDGSLMMVSGRYFSTLGVQPLIGRLIAPDDDVHGAGRPVAVLSHAYWQNRLGGDPQALNQPLRVNGAMLTVVGVAPKGFTGTTFGDQPDAFVPLATKPSLTPGWDGTDRWDDYWVYCLARLKPGVSRVQAETALNTTYRGLVEEQAEATRGNWRIPANRERFRQSRLSLVDGSHGRSSTRDDSRTPLLILMASTALVLLIAVANTANILLARAAQRKRELAIRTALGAGRLRLVRQVLSEAFLLSGAAGIAGLLFASWTVRFLIMAMNDGRVAEDMTAELNWPVLLFALGVSVASGILCGIYPAFEAARSSVAGVLKDEAGQTSATRGAARIRKVLVTAQVTVAAVLLVPTGLFLKSLVNLTRVDLGMKTENIITFRISPELNGYKPEDCGALFERAEQRLAAVPGVRAVATSMVPLISGSNWGSSLTVEGYSRDPKAETHSMFNVIGPGFFGKMGVPLINGREFSDSDTAAAPKAAIINERFARHFFQNANPIGRRFGRGVGSKAQLDYEIIGVVKDSHYSGVKQEPPRLYYLPWRQVNFTGALSFYVRAALAPSAMIPQVRRVMRSLDADLPLEDLRTFDEVVNRNIQSDRLVLQLSAAFSILATLLAVLGLYGVMAYSVTRRTREIGIRIALGAQTGRIRVMVMRELLLILGIGLAAGIPAALGLARYAESELFGVKSFDIAVVAGAALALTMAALLAGYIPARRATRVSPMSALRYE